MKHRIAGACCLRRRRILQAIDLKRFFKKYGVTTTTSHDIIHKLDNWYWDSKLEARP